MIINIFSFEQNKKLCQVNAHEMKCTCAHIISKTIEQSVKIKLLNCNFLVHKNFYLLNVEEKRSFGNSHICVFFIHFWKFLQKKEETKKFGNKFGCFPINFKLVCCSISCYLFNEFYSGNVKLKRKLLTQLEINKKKEKNILANV